MSTNRDINELTPEFREKVERFISHCHAEGFEIFITEGYRTQERQNELYAQGRTKHGPIVTWTLNSSHTQRKAIDIAFNGPELYPNDINVWKDVALIALNYGIMWGYSMWGRDLPHFEDSGIPLDKNEEFNNYKMTPEQTQICEAEIALKKVSHNGGTNEMKELASKQANEWRKLLTSNK